jgi:hypothetical protein
VVTLTEDAVLVPTAFVAVRLTMYWVPRRRSEIVMVCPFSEVRTITLPPFTGVRVTVYLVMRVPPSEAGASQSTRIDSERGTAETIEGALGRSNVEAETAADEGPEPFLPSATTVTR